jgi:hypothetical protein
VDTLLSQSEDARFLLCNQAGRLGANYVEFYKAVEDLKFEIEEVDLASFLSDVPLEKTYMFVIKRKLP